MKIRQIEFTAIVDAPVIEEGDDEAFVIEEAIEATLPSGGKLVSWKFL